MRKTYPCILAMLVICGCGDKDPEVNHPDPLTLEQPVLAIGYMNDECNAGDAEACDVITAYNATRVLCESGDEDGCIGLMEILGAMQGLEETLAQEKCLDPCSEQCVNECASAADDAAAEGCLESCMDTCLDAGC